MGEIFLMLTWSEIESKAVAFQKRWKKNSGDEKQSGQTFEKDFMDVFGVEWRDGLHEHPVYLKDGTTGYIDYFIPGKILIEMKSKGQSLAKAYTQAMSYVHALKPEEIPVLVMCCDFDKIEVYNLKKDHPYKPFKVSQLKQHVRIFGILAGYGLTDEEKTEIEVNTDASYKMAKLHDALKEKGYEGHSLELYLVRLLFCLFAEDTGVFEKEAFEKYIEASNPDGSDLSMRLMTLFSILDTPMDKRPKGLPDDLMRFRYINGSIFKDPLPLASFDSKMRGLLLECSKDFNWSKISPAIFGAMFQGVMDQEERRSLGAHYTSRENIMKVIQPLFLDELYDEFERNKTTRKELLAFQNKLASLHFLDPACGSGNFLIVAYEELRKLEFEVLKLMYDYQENVFLDAMILVKPEQFNGIEIEDFPVQIANLSMILMKHLMDQEISNYFGVNAVDFPIRDTAHIVQGNALRIDWNDVVTAEKLNYIMGNPPFIGADQQTMDQRADMIDLFGSKVKLGYLDYVASWFFKAAEFVGENRIIIAFVSTNSITQGEQVPTLWLQMEKVNYEIIYAYKTFPWENEAKGKAAVHCVIIGFAHKNYAPLTKKLFLEDGSTKLVSYISPYLYPDIKLIVEKRKSPLADISPIFFGSKPTDGGNFIMTEQEKDDLLNTCPSAEKWIKKYINAEDFINRRYRWVLWLAGSNFIELHKCKPIADRIQAVREFRLKSKAETTRNAADTPHLFRQNAHPEEGSYVVIPGVSSSERKYIPLGFVTTDTVASNATFIVPEASLFEFGVLTSNVHMAWIRIFAGRLKSDYRYSKELVYNTFPWPEITDMSRKKITASAEGILNARNLYPTASLLQLYKSSSMPPELRKAHQANDKAVWEAYGKAWDITSEDDCVAHLMKLYAEMTK
ncbi:DNA methyltransferase [Proteiniclasticum sp. QWL-01]|uniref:DNA methyltransferase n=1 Tax=Proteiniclasticum sp. QWL-01 TaxID=3036945 RepID=UPI0024113090|nr:DNA methyltransferase [Proteiniclasticum sp. QWL-01]WFF74038.1 methylase [Proteiniclasticum sp. QWL-01]